MSSRCDVTTQDREIDVDNLLKLYLRACAAVVEQGDSNLSVTTKERAFYRNELRGRLLARLADTERLAACRERYDDERNTPDDQGAKDG